MFSFAFISLHNAVTHFHYVNVWVRMSSVPAFLPRRKYRNWINCYLVSWSYISLLWVIDFDLHTYPQYCSFQLSGFCSGSPQRNELSSSTDDYYKFKKLERLWQEELHKVLHNLNNVGTDWQTTLTSFSFIPFCSHSGQMLESLLTSHWPMVSWRDQCLD